MTAVGQVKRAVMAAIAAAGGAAGSVDLALEGTGGQELR